MKTLGISIISGFQELLAYPLRSILSILGVSIGVFCIVSVSTVFDSMESNIQENMATLGNDVLYIGKFAWMPEEGESEYAWWRYKARPVVTKEEMQLIQRESRLSSYAALSYSYNDALMFKGNKVNAATIYAVTYDFNKLQPIDIERGRYFSAVEMQLGRTNGVILGSDLAEALFQRIQPIDKEIKIGDRKYVVLGLIKKMGQMITGFDFDNAAIISYNYFLSFDRIDQQTNGGFADPLLMIKARSDKKFNSMKFEIESLLRRARRLRANEPNNFAFNQLDGIQEKVGEIFSQIKMIGWIIGGFSLIVGIFSVANIMFVSVKDRTSIIGIKKAIGAQNQTILIEFLLEAVVLCTLGGLLGMLLTFILTQILTGYFEFPIFINAANILYGIILSIVVGIIAGYIPARRAAKMNPVTAIRS